MPDHPDPYPGTPRGVKITGLALVAVLLVAVAIVALGLGGPHGPGRHAPVGGTHDEASAVADGARRVNVTADGLSFRPAEIRVPVGTDVAIALTSVDALHDFVIDELGMHVASRPDETNVGGFHAGPPGRYTFYCSQPGHREAGMTGTLVVDAAHG